MILTILSIIGTAIGVFLIHHFSEKDNEIGWGIGLLLAILSGVMLVSCITYFLCNHASRNEDYIAYQIKHDSLEKRIELVEKGYADNVLWSDITDFNVELKEAQYWKKNPWTNILNNNASLYFDEIEIPASLEELHEQETVEESIQE